MEIKKLFIVLAFLLTFANAISAQDRNGNNKSDNSLSLLIEKLRNLRLLDSTEKNVKKIFGKHCYRRCLYNKDWVINFEYVQEILYTTDVTTKKTIIYKSQSGEYLGKLLSVSVTNYGNKSSSDFFIASKNIKCIKTITFVGGDETSNTRVCSDNQGLIYFVFDEITLYEKLYKNLLYYIHLTLPEEKYNKVFVSEKQ